MAYSWWEALRKHRRNRCEGTLRMTVCDQSSWWEEAPIWEILSCTMPRSKQQLQYFIETLWAPRSSSLVKTLQIHMEFIQYYNVSWYATLPWVEWKLTTVTDPYLWLHIFILAHVFILFHQCPVKSKCWLFTQFSSTSFQDLLLIVQEYCSVIFVTVSDLFITTCFAKLFDCYLLTVCNKHNTRFTCFNAYLHHHPLPASITNVDEAFLIVSLKYSK